MAYHIPEWERLMLARDAGSGKTGLKEASARHRRAAAKAEQLMHARDALIVEALTAGGTHAEIARITGLTRGRIGQLAQEGKAK